MVLSKGDASQVVAITAHYEIRQKGARYDYDLRQRVRFSNSLVSAPLIDFTRKPKLVLETVNSRSSKNKKGVLVSLDYMGTRSISSDLDRYIDNYASWEKAKSDLDVDITVKKLDGTRINSFKKPLKLLTYNDVARLSERKRKRAERINFLLRVSDKGAVINATLDGGPMFGVLKASKKIDL